MAIRDFQDILRALREHPEWREELRRLVLTEELLRLPERVEALTRAVEENTRQIAEHSRQIADLRAVVERLQATVEEHSRQIAELRAAVQDLRATVEALAGRTDRLEGTVKAHDDRLGFVLGRVLVLEYREKAVSYFARLLARLRSVPREEVRSLAEEAVERGDLKEEEMDDLLLADLFLRGRDRRTREETWAVVEVSAGAGVRDVERARERADLLARALARPVLAVVAGRQVLPQARALAREKGVYWVEDGTVHAPDGTPLA